VPATHPTIIASSISLRGADPDPLWLHAGPAFQYAARLARGGVHPRACVIATAGGEQPQWLAQTSHALARLGWVVTHLRLFPMPNIEDFEAHLRAQDIVWVPGGSTANLLALWRLHGLDGALRAAWQAGTVLFGCSAGSICWHRGGTTDSFGLPLQPLTDGLGFLPHSNSPHYDSEPERRPLYQRLVAEGVLGDGYATDNGAGLVYRGTELHEVIAEHDGALGYEVRRADGRAVERALPTRVLR
jgi:peptidase E